MSCNEHIRVGTFGVFILLAALSGKYCSLLLVTTTVSAGFLPPSLLQQLLSSDHELLIGRHGFKTTMES